MQEVPQKKKNGYLHEQTVQIEYIFSMHFFFKLQDLSMQKHGQYRF